jgi:4-amino-4-deoxy-L-arabinose transferase-like glycosyltransferase
MLPSIDFFLASKAARSDAAPARWRRPFLAWLDGIERGWGIPLLIFAFAAIWWLFLVVAYTGADLHVDVLETWSIGRSFAWGNPKHPPLMGWVSHLWATVFPLTDWSFQMLAMANAALALWAVDLIARRFVRGDKRVLVLLLAMLMPVYQFHAQRFNANSVQLAIWPLAVYFFLRSFESRRLIWAVLTGVFCALAMLGKYYSIFLIASLVFAAICHPQRLRYLRSPAPWVSTVVGFAALAPHLYWLATTGAQPFDYAMQIHGGMAFERSLEEVCMFLLGLAAAVALPALVWVLAAGRQLRCFPTDFRNIDPKLWLLFLILIGTVVFPSIVTVTVGTSMPSMWALQGLFLIPVLIVCGASFPIARFYTVNTALLTAVIAIVAVVVAAPLYAIERNAHRSNDRAFYRLAAIELTRLWHQSATGPLQAVSGDDGLAFATAFYSPDHPYYRRPFQYQYTWGMPRVKTLEQGWAALCFAEDSDCMKWMDRVAERALRVIRNEFVVQPVLWGRVGASARVVALIAPPAIADRSIEPPPAEDFSASSRER